MWNANHFRKLSLLVLGLVFILAGMSRVRADSRPLPRIEENAEGYRLVVDDESFVCAQYDRPDNPLFVPEANINPYFAAFAFLTLARFNGLGFVPFGVDDAWQGEALNPRAAEFEDSFRVLRPLLPLIARLQLTGRLHLLLASENVRFL